MYPSHPKKHGKLRNPDLNMKCSMLIVYFIIILINFPKWVIHCQHYTIQCIIFSVVNNNISMDLTYALLFTFLSTAFLDVVLVDNIGTYMFVVEVPDDKKLLFLPARSFFIVRYVCTRS